jgi:hypothetical protein
MSLEKISSLNKFLENAIRVEFIVTTWYRYILYVPMDSTAQFVD